MARNNDLASLAALGALGYMLTRNGDKVDLNQPTSSGDSNPTRAARPESTETRNAPSLNLKTPTESIADADVSSKADSIVSKGLSGTTTPGPAAQSSTGTTTLGPDFSGDIAPAVKSKAVKSKDVKGSNLAPARKKATDMYPSGVMGGARQADAKSATAAPTAKANPPGSKFVPGFGLVDADGNIITGQRDTTMRATSMRNPRTGREMTTFKKKGGAVKMASGGMTSSASRRGDGIATKGKTRGKIC